MIYQHPLAYLLAMEGAALLRGWAGDYEEAYVRARLDEVRRLVADPRLAAHQGVSVARGDLHDAYRQWASSYDSADNPLFGLDEPILFGVIDELAPGVALDAACGTGRITARLTARNHQVVGLDASTDMIEVARRRVPGAEFTVGRLEQIALADASVDLVVCSLALTHLSDLQPVFAEFARVLRPGGHLLVSDVHHERVLLGSIVHVELADGAPGLAPAYRHRPGDYLRAALPMGFEVRRCEEPGTPDDPGETLTTRDLDPGAWEHWPWSLLELVPDAAEAAWAAPSLIVWHFRLGTAQSSAAQPTSKGTTRDHCGRSY